MRDPIFDTEPNGVHKVCTTNYATVKVASVRGLISDSSLGTLKPQESRACSKAKHKGVGRVLTALDLLNALRKKLY